MKSGEEEGKGEMYVGNGGEREQKGGRMCRGSFGRKMVIVQLNSITRPLKNYFIFLPQIHTVNGISALCPCCHKHTHTHTEMSQFPT